MGLLGLKVRRIVVAAVLLAGACSAAPTGDVHFETVQMTIRGKTFTMEVADTDARRERGLMYREKLAADRGMLFVFDEPGRWAFWMKNTKIALDLVFLDGSGKVVGIGALKANDETPVSCDADSQYAMELAAGTVKTLGLKEGERVSMPEKVLKGPSRSDEK